MNEFARSDARHREDLVNDTQAIFLAALEPAEREQLTRLLARVVEHHHG